MSVLNYLDSAARAVLLVIIGALSFFFVPISWITIDQSKTVFIALALVLVLVLWLAARIRTGTIRVPWSMTLAAAALLPLVYAVSTLISPSRSLSLIGTGTEPDTLAAVVLSAAILVLAAILFTAGGIRQALRLFIGGGLVLALFQIVHFIFPSLSLGGVFAAQTGNALGSWHAFGMFFSILTILSIGLLSTAIARDHWRIMLLVSAVISTLVLIVVNFSDLWITLAAGLMGLVLIQGYASGVLKSISFWRSQWPALSLVVLAMLCIFGGSAIPGHLPERIRITQTEVRPSWQGTYSIARPALANPKTLLLGSGPNTFAREWGLHKPLEVNRTPFWNVDFTVGVAPIPTSLVTVGVLGILAWLLFVGTLLGTLIRATTATYTPAYRETLPVAIACLMLIAYHVFSLPSPALSFIMFALIGLLIAQLTHHSVTVQGISIREGVRGYIPAIGAGAVAIVVVVISVVSLRTVAAETLVNRAIVTYSSTQDVARSTRYISDALALYPNDGRAHRAAVQLGLIELQQLAAKADPKLEATQTTLRNKLETTIRHGLSVVTTSGDDYQNWLELASLYSQLSGANVQGAYENARDAYERARIANPTNPVPLLNLGQLEALQQHWDPALKYLEQAVKLKPDFAAAYYLASQIFARQADWKNAVGAAAATVQAAPNDPEAWYNAGVITFAAKDYSNAVIALEKTLTIQPQYANAMYVLGLSYSKLGRTDDSIRVFEALKSLDSSQAIVDTILTNLRAGKPAIDETKAPAPKK